MIGGETPGDRLAGKRSADTRTAHRFVLYVPLLVIILPDWRGRRAESVVRDWIIL